MAQTATPLRPQLAAPRQAPMIEAVRNAAGAFDVDAYHAMDERDTALIEQEILHGAGSAKFVYRFDIRGNEVSGISVVGARHLAAHYGGLKHRLVASVQKTGDLFTFTSYPAKEMPMQVSCAVIPELHDEPDFFGAVVEVSDIKTGNAVQIERRENRYETTRSGAVYERPNYATIAQSKAYRNAVLSLIPQDVQIRWKQEMMRLGRDEVITAGVLDQKRAAVIQFATAKALPLDRRAVEDLTLDQIAGLSEAAHEGALPAFTRAAQALGLVAGEEAEQQPETEPATPAARRQQTAARPASRPRQAEPPQQRQHQDEPPAHLNEAPPLGEAEPVDAGPQRMEPPPTRRVPRQMPDFDV